MVGLEADLEFASSKEGTEDLDLCKALFALYIKCTVKPVTSPDASPDASLDEEELVPGMLGRETWRNDQRLPVAPSQEWQVRVQQSSCKTSDHMSGWLS